MSSRVIRGWMERCARREGKPHAPHVQIHEPAAHLGGDACAGDPVKLRKALRQIASLRELVHQAVLLRAPAQQRHEVTVLHGAQHLQLLLQLGLSLRLAWAETGIHHQNPESDAIERSVRHVDVGGLACCCEKRRIVCVCLGGGERSWADL